jgi:hypothetical protein
MNTSALIHGDNWPVRVLNRVEGGAQKFGQELDEFALECLHHQRRLCLLKELLQKLQAPERKKEKRKKRK